VKTNKGMYDESFWQTVRYGVCEIHYGGRVTDELDRRLIKTIGEHYFNNMRAFMTTPEYQFFDGVPGHATDLPGLPQGAQLLEDTQAPVHGCGGDAEIHPQSPAPGAPAQDGFDRLPGFFRRSRFQKTDRPQPDHLLPIKQGPGPQGFRQPPKEHLPIAGRLPAAVYGLPGPRLLQPLQGPAFDEKSVGTVEEMDPGHRSS
jgi:hypothetical protein